METSRDETRDTVALEKPTWNLLSKNERKTRVSIRTKNVEKSEKGMKLPSAVKNRAMVLPFSSPYRLSMVKLPHGVQNRNTIPP